MVNEVLDLHALGWLPASEADKELVNVVNIQTTCLRFCDCLQIPNISKLSNHLNLMDRHAPHVLIKQWQSCLALSVTRNEKKTQQFQEEQQNHNHDYFIISQT